MGKYSGSWPKQTTWLTPSSHTTESVINRLASLWERYSAQRKAPAFETNDRSYLPSERLLASRSTECNARCSWQQERHQQHRKSEFPEAATAENRDNAWVIFPINLKILFRDSFIILVFDKASDQEQAYRAADANNVNFDFFKNNLNSIMYTK